MDNMKDTLNKIIIRDNATLIGTYDDIKTTTNITFICACGNENSKSMKAFIYWTTGALCKKCVIIQSKTKAKNTNIERYGVEHPLQSYKIMNKSIISSIARYGTQIPSQSNIIKEKTIKTNIERYGVEHPQQSKHIKAKSILTNLERYGVECVFQSSEIKEKCKKTNIKRYGVEYANQSSEIMEKSQRNAKKYKKYIMPSGQIRKVQGYEPLALDTLITYYMENEIKTDRKEVPRISYIKNNTIKYYFPDIYIPHENFIIEVKSTWTYNCKKDNIQLKKQACKDLGFRYEIWCYDRKYNRVELKE